MSPDNALEYIQLALQGYERRILELERQVADLYKFVREVRDSNYQPEPFR